MLFKEDWDETKERLKAWWRGEITDRPLVQIWAPRENPEPYYVEDEKSFPYSPDQWDSYAWGFAKCPDDPERTISVFLRWCAHTYFGGEAYPNLWINLGAGVVGAYLGAEPRLGLDTVWFGAQWDRRFVKTWEQLREEKFDPEQRWYRLTKNITRVAAESSHGRYVVGVTDLGGILDIVASLRGPEQLLIDLLRQPEDVKELSDRIIDWWHACFDELNSISKGHMEGTSAWMNIWSPEDWYPIQCDFAYMLSPRLFDDFVLPHIREQCRRLDRIIYHLDGPGEIPHLSSILSVEDLDGIQWVPGAGEELKGDDCGSEKWIPMYRRILEAGKLLVLSVPSHRVIPLLRHIGPKGVLIQTNCSTEAEGRALLKELGDLT